MDSLVGKTIGKYKFTAVLGSGGMARVYRAIQFPLERTVAVKVLHPHLAEQEEFRNRFLREAKAVATLQNPNIVQIYDYDFENGICYMAMEFLDGMSLDDYLKSITEQDAQRIPLALPKAINIILQVTKALDFAHQQGIVHRDIKPANIMKTADDRIVLADFGIATILNETRFTIDGGTSGTPAYMSPEQALSERGDERSDIYSLGAVLYQLVTGQQPFQADTLYKLIMKHVNDPLPPATTINTKLPLVIEAIINKAMQKEPQNRYQTAKELAEDLQAFLDGKPVKVAKTRYKLPAFFYNKNNKSHFILAGILLIAFMLGALLFFEYKELQTEQAILTEQATLTTQSLAVVTSNDGVSSMTNKVDDGVSSMVAINPNDPLTETFKDNELMWMLSEGDITRELISETYQITIKIPNRAIETHPKMGVAYTNFSLEVEVTLTEGQPESGYGLIFRQQDKDNYYVFAINGLKEWSIWVLEKEEWRELRNLPNNQTWTKAEAILPIGETNSLKVEANGPEIKLFVNNHPLLTDNLLKDDTFLDGGIGFYAASSRTTAEALTKVQFDNLQLIPIQQ